MELMADIKHVEEIEKELTGLFATADDNNLVHMLKEIDSEMAVTVTALKSIKKQVDIIFRSHQSPINGPNLITYSFLIQKCVLKIC